MTAAACIDCPYKGRWFLGCKFEPRYSRTLPPNLNEEAARIAIVLERFDCIYIIDICVRCGTVSLAAESPQSHSLQAVSAEG